MTTNGIRTITLAAAAAVLLLSPHILSAGETKGLDEILGAYESIRQALLHDHLKGVEEKSDQISAIAHALASDFSVERAGVPAEKGEDAKALLPGIATAAEELEKAETLKAARDAFYALTKQLVRYRALASGEKPAVAYCSMAKRSWLQPEGEIGNPYYGQSMARCGSFVER